MNKQCVLIINNLVRRSYRKCNNSCSLIKSLAMANYEKLTEQNIGQFINSFDTILTDCDGVLWNGPDAIAESPEAFAKLKQLGKRIFLVTNNSTKTREEYVTKCLGLGFSVDKEDIIGSGYVTAQYLKDDLGYKGKIYMVGSPGLYQELKAVGYEVECWPQSADSDDTKEMTQKDIREFANMPLDPQVMCVVVGFCKDINYSILTRAASYLQVPDSLFISTNTDPVLPMGDKRFPGTGAILAAVITAAGREPTVICGKPHQPIFDIAHEKHQVNKETTIMIGDRLNTDIELAHNCGLRALHVLTGIHKEEDVRKYQASNSIEDQKQIPHFYVESLGTLGKLAKKISNC